MLFAFLLAARHHLGATAGQLRWPGSRGWKDRGPAGRVPLAVPFILLLSACRRLGTLAA
jgi:hypothetical protein